MNDENKKVASTFEIALLQFCPDGSNIVVVGTHGEILCLDSLSAAILWSIPAHLDQLAKAHMCTSVQSARIPELLVVEESGWVRHHKLFPLRGMCSTVSSH